MHSFGLEFHTVLLVSPYEKEKSRMRRELLQNFSRLAATHLIRESVSTKLVAAAEEEEEAL